MQIKDRAILLSRRVLQERSWVVSVFTEQHGLYSGVVKNVAQKNSHNLGEGNLVDFAWSARLHEHLGYAKVETIKSHNAAIIGNKTKLYAFNSIVSLLKIAFYEREPHNNLFPKLLEFVASLKGEFSVKDYFLLELEILAEAGYELKLEECAASGVREELVYVSPKSGRAVCRKEGEPFANKLLRLPQFLIKDAEATKDEINAARRLNNYFIDRYILHNKPLPKAREDFLRHLTTKL